MAKARAQAKAKRPGRPVTIGGTVTAIVRIPEALSVAIDTWAESVSVSRSEAIRRLIEAGLKRPPKVMGTSR